MHCYDCAIVGNNVAALVSAISLVELGYSVVLFNSTPNFGGIFSGIKLQNMNFDFGMTNFEFSSFSSPSDEVLSYDPMVRNDVGRFALVVQTFIAQYVAFHKVLPLEMFFKGEYLPDLVISNSFEALKMMPPPLRSKIEAELSQIVAHGQSRLHASQKVADQETFLHANFLEASLANHGETLTHELISPMCHKIIGRSPANVPALLHRGAWCPLFYPETLLSNLGEAPQKLTPTEFHYPNNDHFGVIIHSLVKKLRTAPLATINISSIKQVKHDQSWIVNIDNCESVSVKNLVWAADRHQLLERLETPMTYQKSARTSFIMGFARLTTSAIKKTFSSVFIVDPDIGPYRISNQTVIAKQQDDVSRLIVECNAEFLREQLHLQDINQIDAHMRLTLQKMGIIAEDAAILSLDVRTYENVFPLPSLVTVEDFQKVATLTTGHFENLYFVGSAASPYSQSFSDQVVQGLKVAREIDVHDN